MPSTVPPSKPTEPPASPLSTTASCGLCGRPASSVVMSNLAQFGEVDRKYASDDKLTAPHRLSQAILWRSDPADRRERVLTRTMSTGTTEPGASDKIALENII